MMSDLPLNSADAIAVVHDEELKKVRNSLKCCTNSSDFSALVQTKGDDIAGHGYSQIYRADFSSIDEIIHCLLKQAFMFSFHAEIEQFWDGLNSIGRFGYLLKGNSELFVAVLCDRQAKLNTIGFKKLYKVDFSDDGSNQRDSGEKTIYCFELF